MTRGRGSRAVALAAFAGLLLTGCGAPPAPTAPAAAPAGAAYGPAVPAPAPGLAAPVVPPGAETPVPLPDPPAPLALTVPGLGIATGPLIPLGLDPAGALEVPPDATGTGWYVHSPAPGDLGPSIIAAHVDYDGAPGVFARLGDLAPGATVTVRRADGVEVAFVVDRVARYPKAAFPTAEVYGNTAGPELRLITCGGVFDAGTGHYQDNVVAFAHRV